MAKRSSASKKPITSESSAKPKQKENLIELEDRASSPSLPNELNNKIGKIDTDLDDLRS